MADAARRTKFEPHIFGRFFDELGGKDKMALTEKRIAKLKEQGRYADGNRSGLNLQVLRESNRSWL